MVKVLLSSTSFGKVVFPLELIVNRSAPLVASLIVKTPLTFLIAKSSLLFESIKFITGRVLVTLISPVTSTPAEKSALPVNVETPAMLTLSKFV